MSFTQSADLFTCAQPHSTRAACRAISDDVLTKAISAMHEDLPKAIVRLSKMIEDSTRDDGGMSSIFHPAWDCRWPAYDEEQEKEQRGVDARNGMLTPSSDSEGEMLGGASSGSERSFKKNGGREASSMEGVKNGFNKKPAAIYTAVLRAPAHVLELWGALTPMIKELLDMFDLVQLYLLFKTPAAEEGNNTGVEVQQQCTKILLDARRYVLGTQNYLKLYHQQRAKLASKCIKYPQLTDYHHALAERDVEECRDCRYLLSRLRVQAIAVVDVLHKNFQRVSEPKGAASGVAGLGMY